MRTLIIILAGLAVVVLAMRVAKPAKPVVVAWLFAAVWLVVVGWNLATGMSHGYTFQEELPIQAAIFAIPVLAAWMFARKRRRR